MMVTTDTMLRNVNIATASKGRFMLIPRQKTPSLAVETLSHGTFDLASEQTERGIVICFYRGLHCPICANYLTEFEKQTPAFNERGVATIAISSDPKDRAQAMAEKIGAKNLRFGYGLALTAAKEWGLYISTSRGKTSIGIEEPALFSEPGLFMVTPDRTLYYGSVQTMPFVRPHFSELVAALDFAIANNYPARGEYVGAV
jgi:peroxiredoxin